MADADLKSHFTKFLEAFAAKDRKSFLNFIDDRSFLSAIFAEGEVVSGHALFVASQEAWFSSKNGKLSYKVCHLLESGDLGFVSVEAVFSDMGGDPLKLYISFVFQRYGQTWQLLHLQNTELMEVDPQTIPQ